MRKLINQLFNSKGPENTLYLAAEAQLSLEYSRLDKKLLSAYLAQDSVIASDLRMFIQHSLCEADNGRISLEEECLNLKQYSTLFEKYLGNEMLISFDFPVPPNNFMVPPYLLFPLVQDAFHYGYHAGRQHPVRIKGKLIGDMLILEVSNRVNHHIVDQKQTELIQFFRSRLMYEYKDKYDLILNSNSYTFKASLRLNLEL